MACYRFCRRWKSWIMSLVVLLLVFDACFLRCRDSTAQPTPQLRSRGSIDGWSTVTLTSNNYSAHGLDHHHHDTPTHLAASASMAGFIADGGRLPLLLLTHERPALLNSTLTSLLGVRGVYKADILVLQDGTHNETTAVLISFGVTFKQRSDEGLDSGPRTATAQRKQVQQRPAHAYSAGDPNWKDVARRRSERISSHYLYSINYAFGVAFPSAPAVIIVEDDFQFAPDFYEYFHFIAPALEADPTLWLASAWNDNGFDHLVADPYSLCRTGFFPGLGWLLPRRVFFDELKHHWPRYDWDHFLRLPGVHKGRDTVYPEVSRTHHAGVQGSFMTQSMHDQYFDRIALQTNTSCRWMGTPEAADALNAVMQPAHSHRLHQLLTSASTVHLRSIDDLLDLKNGTGTAVLWYTCSTVNTPFNITGHPAFLSLNTERYRWPIGIHEFASSVVECAEAVASYFGIWRDLERGSWRGVHELRWHDGVHLMLVNVDADGGEYGCAISYDDGDVDISRQDPLRHHLRSGAFSGRSGIAPPELDNGNTDTVSARRDPELCPASFMPRGLEPIHGSAFAGLAGPGLES